MRRSWSMSVAMAPEPVQLAVAISGDETAMVRRIASLLGTNGMRVAPARDAELHVFACRAFRNREANSIRALKREWPHAAVLVVARGGEIARARLALEAGASGLLVEDDVDRALCAVLQVLAAGQVSLPSSFSSYDAKPTLTTREKQILSLVVLGFSNGEISRKLYLAESTVKSHLSSAFTKLGVRSRNQATARILDPASGLGPGILRISEEGSRIAGFRTR